MARIWDDVITERDRQVYKLSGYGEAHLDFGKKPALLIIDVNYNFVGDKPEPILESIKRFPYSCGEEGWAAVHQIASLLPLARQKGVTVFYTTKDSTPRPTGWLSIKSSRADEIDHKYDEIVKEIAPAKGDILIRKPRNSAFYGTPLLGMLHGLGTDTLLVCGTTTSGCVRATVIEAFANNLRVGVIEECTFDRAQVSHKINLFDMNAKYANVVSVAEVKKYIRGLKT